MSPRRIIDDAIGSFRPAAMPHLSRGHYLRELPAWAFLPIMIGAVEGGVVGVVANNAFADHVPKIALEYAVATLAGAGAFANILSFAWARWAHGRNKIRFLVALMLAVCVMVGMIAAAPLNTAGLVLLVAGVVGARVCWSGVAMLRSTVWRANYPRADRARIAGKFATIQSVMTVTIALLIASVMEKNEHLFRFIYPAAAGLGAIGAIFYSRMRVRGHRALLLAELDAPLTQRPSFNPRGVLRVLADDRRYRRFMTSQFVFGVGNMMTMAPIILVVKDVFGLGYLGGILITSIIPFACMTFAISGWSRFMDRMHIIQFRAMHSWVFVVTAALLAVATLTQTAALLFGAAALRGIAFGGGVLAWNLGHHDFAPPHRASEYMAVHVTLTGLRGLIAPFLGVSLYRLLEANGFNGGWTFGVCLVLSAIGAFGFVLMWRQERGGDDVTLRD